MTSFAPVRLASVPRMSTRIVSGTRSHNRPVAMTAAVSVAPIPAANAPTAPTMFVWLSLPITRSHGWAYPRSAMSWWTMPWSPTSWNRLIPCLWQKSRIVWCIFAISGVGGGTQWSSVTTIFSGSQTFIVPISLKGSRAIASISCM